MCARNRSADDGRKTVGVLISVMGVNTVNPVRGKRIPPALPMSAHCSSCSYSLRCLFALRWLAA